MGCVEFEQQHMCGNENLHLGQGRAPKDDAVGCGTVNNEKRSGDRRPLGCCSNRDGQMGTSNGLDNITREAHKGCDASVEQVRQDLELVESISKHHIDRVASVHQDTPNVEVRNVGTDNEWVIMGE
ncbi:hypothetical protein L3X38_025445 [Prunus dulcis]|uniref:Uncharacterized protein n=1 Tax=Prunus dulcis TaxID=3755 RepID=A0AAD4W4D9_PRUDU|nr:hypothetical protein L3X38_025445 [Prunus dulcis]